MSTFAKFFIPSVLAVLLVLFLLAIAPVSISRENSKEITAVVSRVSDGGLKDIVVSLEGVRGIYYISHSTKKSLKAEDLNKKLAGMQVTILYLKPGSLSKLNPMTSTIQITELKAGNQVIFSEFR